MVPSAGHQGTHGRCAPTAFRSRRVRFGSAGSRDGVRGISKFRGGVGPSTPLALSTPKEGWPSWILKAHNVPALGVSLARSHGGTSTMTPGFPGQHEVGRFPGVIIVLPLDEVPGTLKAGKVHGVNSIHPFYNHLDRGHTHRELQGDASALGVPDSFQTTGSNTF